MTTQQRQAPQLMQAAVDVSHRIAYLEQRRAYQEALRLKGLERRSFMERLQANQLNHEVTLAQFDQRLKVLEDLMWPAVRFVTSVWREGHWQVLRDKTLRDRDDVQNQIWTIREQLAVSESEIQGAASGVPAARGRVRKVCAYFGAARAAKGKAGFGGYAAR